MSESVIADFVGTFSSELSTRSEPAQGRVVLSQKRLVLAVDDDDKMTIPLSSVFDVAVGHVPPELEGFFDSSVTVAFERDGGRYVAAVEADDETIEKFSTVLFKALLNGTEMTVKHPARRGGRVTDATYRPAKLTVEPRTVRFARPGDDPDVTVDLASVTDFGKATREVAGREREVLQVRHMGGGESQLTAAAAESGRKLSVLGRYLRLEYTDLMEDLREVELGEEETELLVALYSGAGGEGMSLANVVGADASRVTMLLNRLEEAELVAVGDDGPTLTPKGQVVVSNHLEDVNA